MSDRIKGQRDSHGDNWSWGPPGGGGRTPGSQRPPRVPWRPFLLVVAAVVLIGTGVGLLALANDDGGDSSVDRSATPTPDRRPSGTVEDSASPEVSGSPIQTSGAVTVHLFAWSRQGNEWVDTELPAGTGYREGDAIPMLLQIDQTTPGTFYETIVRFQCKTDRSAGFDFLALPATLDSGAILAEPGPGRGRPDSSVPIPNDPSTTFDDGSSGRFQLWGATFQQSLQGPLPPGPCEGEKEFHLIPVAAGNTVSLVWANHLAAAGDWGEGKGSASAQAPLMTEVTIVGVGDARLTVTDGAISP